VVNNQLVVLTRNDTDTKVTGLEDLDKAKSMALADGSVPVGKYTLVIPSLAENGRDIIITSLCLLLPPAYDNLSIISIRSRQ
jgi:hypothetical protein